MRVSFPPSMNNNSFVKPANKNNHKKQPAFKALYYVDEFCVNDIIAKYGAKPYKHFLQKQPEKHLVDIFGNSPFIKKLSEKTDVAVAEGYTDSPVENEILGCFKISFKDPDNKNDISKKNKIEVMNISISDYYKEHIWDKAKKIMYKLPPYNVLKKGEFAYDDFIYVNDNMYVLRGR